MKKILKRMISCGMAVIMICAMSITSFAQAENEFSNEKNSEVMAVQTVQPRATHSDNVVALPKEFQGQTFHFTGSYVTVAASGTIESGTASSVTVRLWKKNWLGTYKPYSDPATLIPNGQTVTLFRDLKISSGDYYFTYQVNGSDTGTVRVILTAVTY